MQKELNNQLVNQDSQSKRLLNSMHVVTFTTGYRKTANDQRGSRQEENRWKVG